MARFEVKSVVTVKSSPERAFDCFADYHHVAQVLDGVSKWQPVGTNSRGVGARYNVELVAFGLPLKSVLRLNRWRRPAEIGWVSESGLIKQDGGFTFEKVKAGVRIELRIAYEPPASFVGAALARPLDRMVRERLKQAMERIRDRLEAQE
ncbi:MAG TPA: SRPBCC family protein [Candidatus Angelobacter sp.]|nr:SRPBCC family protein [Candidatus Angelobacter sp.]